MHLTFRETAVHLILTSVSNGIKLHHTLYLKKMLFQNSRNCQMIQLCNIINLMLH